MSDIKPYEQVICTVDLERLEAQRDQLLSAAKSVILAIKGLPFNAGDRQKAIQKLEAAVAAAESKGQGG